MRVKRYQKKFNYSYAFGIYPVIDLLKYRKNSVIKILKKSVTDGSKGGRELEELCREVGIEVEEADRAIERIAFKENTYFVGVFDKYECSLDAGENHLVLVEPRNMGNIGTIIRTMLGFGYRNLALVGECADIFDPKVVSSTTGALFRVNFKYYKDIQEYMSEFPNHTYYPFMLDGGQDIRTVEFEEPYSMIQGNESKGLSDEYKDIGQSVFIPHAKDIDSLNLSIATAIGLWEVGRRK
ncbi:TrmH family RNA methyltransferase [bacterium]|nr:TrmH family RNA methyltransferase [bacterium]